MNAPNGFRSVGSNRKSVNERGRALGPSNLARRILAPGRPPPQFPRFRAVALCASYVVRLVGSTRCRGGSNGLTFPEVESTASLWAAKYADHHGRGTIPAGQNCDGLITPVACRPSLGHHAVLLRSLLPLRRCGQSISPSHDNSWEHVSEVPRPSALTFH